MLGRRHVRQAEIALEAMLPLAAGSGAVVVGGGWSQTEVEVSEDGGTRSAHVTRHSREVLARLQLK